MSTSILKKPPWIRAKVPFDETWKQVEAILKKQALHTVCDQAHCPNKGECWGAGTATFMILGERCTRSCRFCAVSAGPRGDAVRPDEGAAIACAAVELGLTYAVITSPDRDDLPDRGAGQFASCVKTVKQTIPGIGVEVLIPDYTDSELALIAETLPDVAAHNVETVRSLQGIRDPRASFDKSLATLRGAKYAGVRITKTSLLLGFGEKEAEVLSVMDELREAGADILVLGQYLRPSQKQIPVTEYLPPERFEAYACAGRERGFEAVIASPFARTSYRAFHVWKSCDPG
jgi:lipoic acid synthetase